jgi:hypothetical protein
MKRSLQTCLALALLFVGLSHTDSFGRQRVKKPVQTTSVTGTYKYVLNSLEVLELPDHKVRISFAGYWPNDRKRAETRNVGAFDETVPLDGHTATVKIQFGSDPCTVTLEFRSNKVIVEQGGSLLGCGFGFNVEADGTYVKVSSKPPKLPPPEKQ